MAHAYKKNNRCYLIWTLIIIPPKSLACRQKNVRQKPQNAQPYTGPPARTGSHHRDRHHYSALDSVFFGKGNAKELSAQRTLKTMGASVRKENQ